MDGPVTTKQISSQDEVRNVIREMVKESQMKPLALDTLVDAVKKNPLAKETDMDDDVITESITLRFSCPSRAQLAKAANYFTIGRATGGLGKIIVRPIEGGMGNWYFDVSSNAENQFLNPNHMNNVLPAEVTVTRMTGGPVPTTQTASQDETRNIIREMVEKKLNELRSQNP
jgi:hypothetical protein